MYRRFVSLATSFASKHTKPDRRLDCLYHSLLSWKLKDNDRASDSDTFSFLVIFGVFRTSTQCRGSRRSATAVRCSYTRTVLFSSLDSSKEQKDRDQVGRRHGQRACKEKRREERPSTSPKLTSLLFARPVLRKGSPYLCFCPATSHRESKEDVFPPKMLLAAMVLKLGLARRFLCAVVRPVKTM